MKRGHPKWGSVIAIGVSTVRTPCFTFNPNFPVPVRFLSSCLILNALHCEFRLLFNPPPPLNKAREPRESAPQHAMLAFGIGLGLAAPTPLGRMDSQDFTSDYSQLQVLQTAAPDMHQVAAPAPASDIADDTEHSKDATSDLLKAAKKAEHEGRKASKDAEKAEAREQLKAQKEREHALQKAQSDEEKRNAEARKEEAHATAEEAQPLVRSSSDDAKSGVNTAQEKRKAVKEEERAKLKAQKEKERAAQKEANKLERERLNADAREAQKRLADSQRQVGVDAPADKAVPAEEQGREQEVTDGGVDERDAMKAAARVQRDAEKAAAKAQNDEQKANAKAQNAAERARAKEQTEQLKAAN